ncbi:unnamed protein product [Penicillium crustosum]
MAQRQSHSSPPPYVVSSPSLHYDDVVSNNTHGWTYREPNYATSSRPIHHPHQQPEYWPPSAYRGSDDTYQQPWVQYPNTEQSAPPLYPDQNKNHFVQQQPVARGAKLCVIPQITKVFGGANMSPFARARARELEAQTGLTQEDLLCFIDGLNEAFLANPALQATNKIAMLVGFVPLATAQIVGSGLQVATSLGSAGVSAVRTKQYLKKANEVIFNPKGLLVRVVKTDKMLSLVGVRDSRVFSAEQYRALVGRDESQSQSPLVTRMAALGDRVMSLSFDELAAPVDEDNWMKKWGAYSAQKAEKKQLEKLEKEERRYKKAGEKEKKDKKSRRNERKVENAVADLKDDIEDIKERMQCLNPRQPDESKTGRELLRKLRSLERKLAELEEDREDTLSQKSDKREKIQAKRDQKEAKKVNKLHWIVILPADTSTGDEEHDLDSDDR